MKQSDFEIPAVIAAILLIITIPISIWIFQSYMEATAFNKLTNGSVSTFDAMWVELRVTGNE